MGGAGRRRHAGQLAAMQVGRNVRGSWASMPRIGGRPSAVESRGAQSQCPLMRAARTWVTSCSKFSAVISITAVTVRMPRTLGWRLWTGLLPGVLPVKALLGRCSRGWNTQALHDVD